MNRPSSASASWKDTKPRNILTLDERVNVIRAYEKKPVYQKIAHMFKCSTKQIKNIIANRESILLYYANRMEDGSSNEAKRQRQEKIAFLGKVMYEYLLRAQCHNIDTPLTVQILRAKALEVKDAIEIPNFYPNNAWMNNFKTEFGITDFGIPVLDINSARDIPASLDTCDIISYINGGDQQPNECDGIRNPYDLVAAQYDNDSDDGAISGSGGKSDNANNYEDGNSHDYNNGYNDFVMSLESDDESNLNGPPPKIQKVESMASTPKRTPSESCDKQIVSYVEALKYLKPLEDFVLIQENYRAIGLLSQLEKVFKNAPSQPQ